MWPDGNYEADVFIDHDTLGTKDVKVHVACIVSGDQLTVDLTGTDARPELVGVWNTFANSRGYVMTQIASAIDPGIVKNEGLFNAVEIIIPENTIAHPPPNKPAALGSFHPGLRDHRSRMHCFVADRARAFRAAGLQNRHAQCGDRLQERTDVDGPGCRCAHHGCIRRPRGIDGWGSCPVALGNLLLSEAEDGESRFPVINISREMTIDSEGAGRWRGQPGSLNVKQVLEPTMAMAWMVSAAHPLRGCAAATTPVPIPIISKWGRPMSSRSR